MGCNIGQNNKGQIFLQESNFDSEENFFRKVNQMKVLLSWLACRGIHKISYDNLTIILKVGVTCPEPDCVRLSQPFAVSYSDIEFHRIFFRKRVFK